MIDTTPFDDFNKFFAWYITMIKAKVPNYMALSSDDIHKKMGKLSTEEFYFVCNEIRDIQQVPYQIRFENNNNEGTFYARWDMDYKCPIIGFPTVMKFWLRYPPIVRAIIQHELGHCVGETPDILTNTEKFTDRKLINISMDVRINQNIMDKDGSYATLAEVYKCTYTFDNNPFELPYVPEYWMPEKCGMPSSLKTSATWTWLYKCYKDYMGQDSTPEDIAEKVLELNQFVETIVEKYGIPKKTLGIVSGIKQDIGKKIYEISETTKAEQEAIANDDYEFFRKGINGSITRNVFGEYEYNKALKEVKPVPIPVFQDNKPKVGDIAQLIKDKSTIKKGRMGMVVFKVSENEFLIDEFNDLVQDIIIKKDFNAFIEALKTTNVFTGNEENCIFAKEFILNNLEPPPTGGGDPPPPEKKIEKPQVGDVVVIERGANAGKYAVITEVVNDKFILEEVSEEMVLIKTGRKI